MRDFKRLTPQRPPRARVKLSRGADGRLYSVEGEGDINDIWAEQKRIRLKEAIEQDKRRLERKVQRKEKLLGFVKKATTAPKLKNIQPKKLVPKASSVKVIIKKWRKKHTIGSVVAAILVFSVVGFMSYGGQGNDSQKKSGANGVLGGAEKGPEFTTILPAGKNIEDLGGWGRVSPPDKEPVYAFVDEVGAAAVRVSQQPLPESFKGNLESSLTDLAKQFAASRTIQVDESTVHIGTSEKGPQSLILFRKDLLILIKSDRTISDDQWVGYIASLM